jgi:hypothetical protein
MKRFRKWLKRWGNPSSPNRDPVDEKRMNYVYQIRGYLQSLCKLFYLGTASHKLAVRKCVEIAAEFSMEVYVYNLGEGLRRPDKDKPKDATIDPLEMLNRILSVRLEPFAGKRKLYILEHFDLLLENRDPFLLTRLRLIADAESNTYSVILMGKDSFRVPEIIRDIPQITVAVLSPDEMVGIIENCGEKLPEMKRRALGANLQGLTSLQCEDLLALSLATRNALDPQFIRKERARLLSQQAGKVIQLCEPLGDLEQVGGLDVLKDWLIKRGRHFHVQDSGKCASLPQPRGVLLTGPPGCGKSYLVQALAGSWGVNLVRLEPARLFRSFVGETEQNFLSAFETVLALAPAVLWIDELEKLFDHGAGQSGDGGVLSRVLSLFLDFLQSSREGTFVCATTNAIAGLPQEILRPGRFDALFFIDLPTRREREHILTILFRKYGLAGKLEVSQDHLTATEDFSGAEMEQAAIEMLYETEGNGLNPNEFALLRNIRKVVPLSRTMRENFDLMRKWYSTRARAASLEDDEDKGRRRICPISPR